MVSLLAAFQFLTIFPALIRRPFTARELGTATGWYPLVGLALGGVLTGLQVVSASVVPALVSAGVVLSAWVVLTRALHYDGFVDTCDALFGGFTPERRLEIMRDSRIGAFGHAGGTLLLLLKFAALASPAGSLPGLLLAPVFGRWGLTLALYGFPYARERGLGRDVKDNVRWTQAALASLIALVSAWLAGGVLGLALAGVSALAVLAGAWYIRRLIPGLTGDSYGALCESLELLALLLAPVFA